MTSFCLSEQQSYASNASDRNLVYNVIMTILYLVCHHHSNPKSHKNEVCSILKDLLLELNGFEMFYNIKIYYITIKLNDI